ncbi:FUN14 family-domain-containing protein [Lentinula aff. detonsa]|uniref:FUN14 family-domain-containing protein n=1 Tax=Lentinula aff. detonsa TaxID=2804958 RepID=A0AA38KTC7_9AGAR|nr:FUN14 family-domain-containing protein [Lentinula aff. detonsa]
MTSHAMSSPIFNVSRRCIGPQRFSQLFPTQSRLLSNNAGLHTLRLPPIGRIRIFSGPVFKAIGLSGLGLGLSLYIQPFIKCEPPAVSTVRSPESSTQSGSLPPPPPKSSVSLYELSFGTAAGICAGVFLKKGAKAVAFFLGGVFVLLQYLGSFSLLRVDWTRVGHRFESLFYTTDATGTKRAPTVWTAWNWLVNFLTADFQPRASFLAGLALGLRIG